MEFLSLSSQQVFYPIIPFIGFRIPFPFSMDSFAAAAAAARKEKVVFVMGTTGTGKSKLAISLALHFGGEVVNSDKMQVYDGLHVTTNKVTDAERAGVVHHLLGGVHPDADFSAADFRRAATRAVEDVLARGRLPIVAGGSNSYIEELVDGAGGEFRSRFECCFLWVDVELPVLQAALAARLDEMVERGLVEEARGVFDPAADYSRGIRRAIGVPELDRYLRAEAADEEARRRMLAVAIDEMKANTCKLACSQLQKIHRLSTLAGWDLLRFDATEVFRAKGAAAEEAWERDVRGPSVDVVQKFLSGTSNTVTTATTTVTTTASVGADTATITATVDAATDTGRTEILERKKYISVATVQNYAPITTITTAIPTASDVIAATVVAATTITRGTEA